MKKSLFVLALAAILVFAFAAVAFADITFAPTGFTAWDSTAPNNNPATPHKGYTATTTKCGVCHSVHYADNIVGGANQAILLNTTVANACIYCHIDTNVGVTQVYDGVRWNYLQDFGGNHSSAGSIAAYEGCTSCHSVHGANTMNGAETAYILTNYGSGDTAFTPAVIAESAVRGDQLNYYCSQCHPFFTSKYDVATDPEADESIEGNHVLKSAGVVYGNHESGKFTNNGTVAWAGSNYCYSCHDAPSGFPHASIGYDAFMQGGEYAGSGGGPLADQSQDGACLKCHRDTPTKGVGFDF